MEPGDFTLARDALGGKGDLAVRWLGTAGFELTCEGHTLLIDPYLTRASLRRCLTGRLAPDLPLLRRCIPRADAIVLGHTHFDHALDAPAIARQTGARVFGSRSAAHLCRAEGVPAGQVVVVEGAATHEVGPFRLVFHPSAHSKLLLGRVPFEGDIADCDSVPMRAEAYRCGAVFGLEILAAGRRIFHLGSAEIVDSVPRLEVDLALVCVAGWHASPAFPERMAPRLSPATVLLSHWDNFLRPLDDGPRHLPAIQTMRFVDRMAAAARGVRIGTLPYFGELLV